MHTTKSAPKLATSYIAASQNHILPVITFHVAGMLHLGAVEFSTSLTEWLSLIQHYKEPCPTLQRALLDVTEHFWPKIWSHFRPYCLSLHSLTVSFSSEPQMIFSHFFRNFVGLLQDYFLSISVLMLIPIISYIAQGQCFNFLLWN